MQRIVGWYKLALSPEEVAHRIGHLTLAQVALQGAEPDMPRVLKTNRSTQTSPGTTLVLMRTTEVKPGFWRSNNPSDWREVAAHTGLPARGIRGNVRSDSEGRSPRG